MMRSNHTSLFLKNSDYSEFDLRKDDSIQIRVWSNKSSMTATKASSYLDLVSLFTLDTGRPKPIADWYHKGAIVGIMGGTDYVYKIHNALKKRQAAISSYWLQDWVGTRETTLGTRLKWNWDLDKKRYPDFKKLLNTMKAQGIEILGYINPSSQKIDKLSDERQDLYEEYKAKGYLVKDSKGNPCRQTAVDSVVVLST